MGWTIRSTNDAFEAVGFDIDLDTEEEIAVLRDILLYHVSFGGPYALSLSLPYSLDWMPMANEVMKIPTITVLNQTILVENDCPDILVNREATVIDADNRVYGYEYNGVDGYPFNDQLPQGWAIAEDNGMIQVVDALLIPVQYRQPDVPFVFAPEAVEEDVSETNEEENPVENETQLNETETEEADETNPEDGSGGIEEIPVVWECMTERGLTLISLTMESSIVRTEPTNTLHLLRKFRTMMSYPKKRLLKLLKMQRSKAQKAHRQL